MLYLSRIQCLGEALRDAMVAYKSNDALLEANRHRDGESYTYVDLRRRGEAFGGWLQSHDFAAGDRLAVIMQNQPTWLVGACGGLWAGAVLVPLDYKLTAREQLGLLRHSAPKALLTEYSSWHKLRAEDRDVLAGSLVIVTDAPDDADLGHAVRWNDAAADGLEMRDRSREDLACIVYSSGTSGTPKGCMLSHGNYLAQAEVLSELFPFEPTDRYFSILPTNHAIDFMCGFVIPLLSGGAVVHQRALRPQYLAPSMRRFKVTHMALVPTILKALERRVRDRLDDLPQWQRKVIDGLMDFNEGLTKRSPNYALSKRMLKPLHDAFGGHLRLMFCGGAFVERSSAEFFNRLGIPVAIGYGLTEAGTVLTVNDLKPFRGDSVGRPVPGTEIEIRNANEHGVGEVWARGPTVMMGYLEEPDFTAETIVDGWLKTGDLGVMDAAGHLRLVGRAKNMIVTEGGKNIYPEDVEAIFDDISGCSEHCVFAANYLWPQQTMVGEQLTLVLRLKEGADAEAVLDEVRRRNRRAADFKRVSSYILLENEFPRTASMKLKRGVLRDTLSEKNRDAVTRSL